MADDIAQWLEGLGLGQYAQAFAENGVDLEVLPDLGEKDFDRLGVLLGHQKKMLRAIAALSPDEVSARQALPPTQQTKQQPADAERRQLTVMFCDLVGSTALSSQLDPEDMREVLRAYQEAVTSVVERYDGHVAKYLGDGVLTYFGWPRAHEDDAERAMRAGLEAVAAVAAIPTGKDIRLQARVGIASGVVVAGDMVSEGVSEEGAIAGETPNLAARFQEIAEPSSVVIGEATHRLARRPTDWRADCSNVVTSGRNL